MPPTPAQDALLQEEIAAHKIGSRTDSAAMLAWYLQAVWREEPEDADSAICDGGGDKGIDALLVDEDLNEITVIQSKHRVNPAKSTQGDQDLKNLVGAAAWFESPEKIDALVDSKPNQELKNLLIRQGVKEKLASGAFVVRLVFITNADLDAAGLAYAELRKDGSPPLEIWDRQKMVEAAERTRRPELRSEAWTLHAQGAPITANLTDDEVMAVALVPASELVKLPGIANRTLFSRNVRLFVGRTRINKQLQSTVRTLDEHRLFPAFHNGMTLLTSHLEVDGSELRLTGVGVVNGCQSLITLHENQDSITDELQILVKIIETGSNSSVADLITYRSNNQNAVTLRDQRSSDPAMRDLQNGVSASCDGHFALETRVGENLKAQHVLENTTAAQLIMAAYLSEPSLAVRKVRLFDQDYRRIFNRKITPHKLWLLYLINESIKNSRPSLRSDLRASFASVRFTLVHLVCQVLRLSDAGVQLLDEPERWLREEEPKVVEALALIASEVVDSVNDFIEVALEEDADYDPKVAFKSRTGVKKLETEVVRDARRQVRRGSSPYLFTVTPALHKGV